MIKSGLGSAFFRYLEDRKCFFIMVLYKSFIADIMLFQQSCADMSRRQLFQTDRKRGAKIRKSYPCSMLICISNILTHFKILFCHLPFISFECSPQVTPPQTMCVVYAPTPLPSSWFMWEPHTCPSRSRPLTRPTTSSTVCSGTHTHSPMHTHTYAHMHTHLHSHTHTHTHTQQQQVHEL